MRIGILCLWSPPYDGKMTGGLITAQLLLKRHLFNWGIDADLFTYGKLRKGMYDCFQYLGDDFTPLNKYDFLIVSTTGSYTKKKDVTIPKQVLSFTQQVTVPFATQAHHECETNMLTAQRELFNAMPNFRMVMPITEKLDAGITWPERIQRHVYLAIPDTITLRPMDAKVDKIITTCRYTSTKRLLELARQAEKLRIRIEMHGSDIAYFYYNAVKALEGEHLKCFGFFGPLEFPGIVSEAKWHYNCTSHRNAPVLRVEISTAEAVEYGCIPILHKHATAPWVTEDMAILVDPAKIEREEILDAKCKSPVPFIEAYNAQYGNKTQRLLDKIYEVME